MAIAKTAKKTVKKATSLAEKKSATAKATKESEKLSPGVKRGIPDDEFYVIGERNYGSMWATIVGAEGFPKGKIVEFYGDSEVGKTGSLMQIAGMFQRQGLDYGHCDAERAMNKRFAKKRLNVDVDNMLVPNEDKKHLVSGEDWFSAAFDLIEAGAKILVIDSVAALQPEERMKQEKDRIGAHANLMSKKFPILAERAAAHGCTVFTVNQTRVNIGVLFGDNTTTTGGKAPGFWSSVRFQVRKKKVKRGPNGEELGYIVVYTPAKNRCGFKRGAFEVHMTRGFIPDLATTAAAWAKGYEAAKLVDKEKKTICGLPISGRADSDDALADAVRGKEHVVFEAVNSYFEELEDSGVIKFSEDDDTESLNAQTKDLTVAEVVISEDEARALKAFTDEGEV